MTNLRVLSAGALLYGFPYCFEKRFKVSCLREPYLIHVVGRFGDKRAERENFGPSPLRCSAEIYPRSPRLLAISAFQNRAENDRRIKTGGEGGIRTQVRSRLNDTYMLPNKTVSVFILLRVSGGSGTPLGRHYGRSARSSLHWPARMRVQETRPGADGVTPIVRDACKCRGGAPGGGRIARCGHASPQRASQARCRA